jgi:DNA helicase-2/ATP-dependent DNA helicase PcrA
MFSRVKNDATPWNNIPDRLMEISAQYDLNGQSVVRIWELYEATKLTEGLIDFDDMIYSVWMALNGNHWEAKNLLERIRTRIQHLIVDEAQDLNLIQLRMAELLGGGGSLMLVGDLRQSIYGFRGAHPQQVLALASKLKMETLYLTKNYRSGYELVERGSDLISNGSVEKAFPRASAVASDSGKINIVTPSDEFDEAGLVAAEIEELRDLAIPLHEIAVIYRTNAQSVLIQQALNRAGVPVYFVGGMNFFGRKEIMDALAYLKLKLNPSDVESFKRVYNLPTRYLGNAFMGEFARLHDAGTPVVATLGQMIYCGSWKRNVKDLIADLNMINSATTPAEALDAVYALRSKLKKQDSFLELYKTDDEEDSMRTDNLMALRAMAAGFDDLNAFLEECDRQAANTDPSDQGKDKVHLVTVHRAKGLEYDETFVIGVVDGIMPHSKGNVEEERRVAYVAFTRARKRLTITSPSVFRDRAATPSMFIDELSVPAISG